MNILLGLTGSVATTVAPKIIGAMELVPCCRSVKVVMTEKACMFWNPEALSRKAGVKVYTERDEWTWERRNPLDGGMQTYDKWRKDDPIRHVELAKRSACLVVAPASMNTIAKMANGITDNLLTSVYAAWDRSKPVIVAPAMNTNMLMSPASQRNLSQLVVDGCTIVSPVKKELACGDVGNGGLADAGEIASIVMLKLGVSEVRL